ncbi:MAG: ABC transporter substrate-binding protein [Comamonas sp.]
MHIPRLASAAALALAASFVHAAEGDIVIGASLPLSGFNAAVGQEALKVTNAYFEAVNNAGGIAGRPLRLEALDDRFDPAIAAQNVRKLASEGKAVAVFNCFGTATCNEAAPAANAGGIPLVGGLAGGGAMREQPGRFVFNVRAGTRQEIQHMVQHMQTIGYQNIALVYQDDAFGRSGKQAAGTVFAASKVQPVAELALSIDGSDAAKVAQSLAALPLVHGVVVVASTPGTAKLILAARQAGLTAQFYNLAAQANPVMVKSLGERRSGVVFTTLVPNPWKKHVPVAGDYQKTLGQADYSYLGMEVFINAQVLVEGLRKAGRGVSRDSLREALESMGERRYGSLSIRYAPDNHMGSQYVGLTMINRAGEFIE